MTRLLWKETREQGPMAVATLALPALLWLHYRATDKTGAVWPTSHDDLFTFYVFASVWGSQVITAERVRGRLTLSTLPVPRWRVWAVKTLPGFTSCLVAAGIAVLLGHIQAQHLPDRAHLTWAASAGTAALAFSVAFMTSLAFGAWLGTAIGLFTALISGELVGQLREGWNAEATLPGLLLLGVAVILLLLCLWAMTTQTDLLHPWRWRGIAAVVLLIPASFVLIPIPSEMFLFYRDPLTPFRLPSGVIAVTRRYNMVAYTDLRPVRITVGTNDTAWRSSLWVRDLDGGNARLVYEYLPAAGGKVPDTYAIGHSLAPIGWLTDRRLLYGFSDPRKRTLELLAWSPETAKSHVVTSLGHGAPPADALPYLTAIEPGGARIAVLRPPVGARIPGDGMDLWLLDGNTGQWTLRMPGANASDVAWRQGRIWLTRSGIIVSLAAEGGPPRPEGALPEEVNS